MGSKFIKKPASKFSRFMKSIFSGLDEDEDSYGGLALPSGDYAASSNIANHAKKEKQQPASNFIEAASAKKMVADDAEKFALDVLDAVPEVHDLMKSAKENGVSVERVGQETIGSDGGQYRHKEKKLFYKAEARDALESHESKYLTQKDCDREVGRVAPWIADTISHELRHYSQYSEVGSYKEFFADGGNTARAHTIVDRVIEADANAFQDLIREKSRIALGLKNKGMSNSEVRDYMRETADPEEDKKKMLEGFKKHLSGNRADRYDVRSVQFGYEKHHKEAAVDLSDDKLSVKGSYQQEPSMDKFFGKLRSSVGKYAYLDDVSDRELARMVLSPMQDDARKAMWSIDAHARAVDRVKDGASSSVDNIKLTEAKMHERVGAVSKKAQAPKSPSLS